MHPQANVYLYGSHAKGTATRDSDIDICILIENAHNLKRFNPTLNNYLTDLTGKAVHCVYCKVKNGWCEKLLNPKNNG